MEGASYKEESEKDLAVHWVEDQVEMARGDRIEVCQLSQASQVLINLL